MIRNKNLFFIDAETDGLYGSFISVGLIVTDCNCDEIESFYYGVSRNNLKITDKWVEKNVLPILGDYVECQDENELINRVWSIWLKYADVSYAVADVMFPVEARLFTECVRRHPGSDMKGPFPLIDLSSLLLAKGIDPLADRESLVNKELENVARHNALDDVRMSIEIWKKYML